MPLGLPGRHHEGDHAVGDHALVGARVPVGGDDAGIDESGHVGLEREGHVVGEQACGDGSTLVARGAERGLELDILAGIGGLEGLDGLGIGLTRRGVSDDGHGAGRGHERVGGAARTRRVSGRSCRRERGRQRERQARDGERAAAVSGGHDRLLEIPTIRLRPMGTGDNTAQAAERMRVTTHRMIPHCSHIVDRHTRQDDRHKGCAPSVAALRARSRHSQQACTRDDVALTSRLKEARRIRAARSLPCPPGRAVAGRARTPDPQASCAIGDP